jgi:hypothetical protein
MHGPVHGKGWLEVLQEGSGGALSSAQMNPILRSGRPDGRGHGARGLRQGRRPVGPGPPSSTRPAPEPAPAAVDAAVRLTEYPVPGGLPGQQTGLRLDLDRYLRYYNTQRGPHRPLATLAEVLGKAKPWHKRR